MGNAVTEALYRDRLERAQKEAAGIEVKDLPRRDYPRTWTAVSSKQMLIGRRLEGSGMERLLIQEDALTFHRDVYIDCIFCRKKRFDNARVYHAHGPLHRDRYWCNECQATGWLVEPIARTRDRLGLSTWEEKAAALTDLEIDYEYTAKTSEYPREVLVKEIAKRWRTLMVAPRNEVLTRALADE